MEPESGGWTWLLIGVVFVAILGAAILYGIMMTRRRRRDRLTQARRDEGTRELYDKSPPCDGAIVGTGPTVSASRSPAVNRSVAALSCPLS